MDIFTRKDIEELMNPEEGLCVSLYMPTHRTGPDVRQDPILLKNLLNQAEEELVNANVNRLVVNTMLKPAKELIDDYKFWRNQSNGLAIFASAKKFLMYKVPQSFDKLLVVTSRFHIKPMIPILSNNQSFNILGVSQDLIRFFQCTMNSISEVELEGVPTSMKDALGYEDFERYLQFHTQTGSGEGKRSAVFHGHGDDTREVKEDILRYFRIVDEAMKEYFEDSSTPLIIAGVDYLIPIYKEASNYPNILDKGIKGNPDEKKPDDIHAEAVELIKPILEKNLENDISKYKELIGQKSNGASDEMKKIIFSAAHGRVDTLFVALGKHLWGYMDIENNKVHTHKKPQAGDEDLLDYAAGKTLVNSGKVYALPPEKMPDELSLAAIFRY